MVTLQLDEWVQRTALTEKRIQQLKHQFQNSEPFPHLEMRDFFSEEKVAIVLKALSKEKLYEKESDLFKFMQTADLNFTKNKMLKEFCGFMRSEEFISYIEEITGLHLQQGKVDVFGSVYQDADYLLSHDDLLEGRKIAFNVYLSTLGKKEGGSLNLFGSRQGKPLKIEKKILPRFNTLALFEVSPISFHEVEEVLVEKQRIALSGWWYDAF